MSSRTPVNDDDNSEANLVSNEQQHDKSISAMTKSNNEGHEVFTEVSELNLVDIAACNERCEPNVQKADAFLSATPIVDGNHLSKMFLPKSIIEDEGPGLIRENKDEYGLQVLSIYCAHMASKWNNILKLRPRQSKDMSVEAYYDLFFRWKLRLEQVNYIGDEDSYIDDFLYGLKTELAVRVWVYKWKPRTLYGAFRRAEIEENKMKNDAHMVLEEMPQSNPFDILDAEVALYENDDVLTASGLWDVKFQLDLPSESNSFQSVESQMDVLASTSIVVYHETPARETENMEQTLSDVVRKLPVMKLEYLQVARNLFDELLTQFSAKQNIGCEGLGKWDQSMVDCKDAAMEMMLGEIVVFMFDPGISSMFDEMFKFSQGAEQVIDLYDHDVKLIKLALFDPSGGRYGVVCFSRRDTHPLLGKYQEMYIFGFKGVTSLRKDANSFISTWEMLGLFVSSFVENEWGLAGLSSHSNNNLVYTIFGKCENIYSVNDMFMLVFDPGGCLLDLLGTSSVTSCLALHNINAVMPVIPCVLCAHVSQQLMFSMKAYSITALLKGGDPLWKMVNRFVIIQASLLMSIICCLSSCYSFQLGERVYFSIIKTYEKNNIAGNAFRILEYFVDATTIIVLAVLDRFIWDPGEDVISFYILVGKDVFERVGNWIIPMDRISEFIFTLPTLNLTMTSMVLYKNVFSKLMTWSTTLSYNHIYVKIRMQWTDHDLKHCVVSISHLNRAHMGMFVIIYDHSVAGWSSVGRYNKWVDLLHICFLSVGELNRHETFFFKDVAWCFNGFRSYALMQEIINSFLAISRKVFMMALFPISCAFYSRWQYHSMKEKSMEPTICFVDLLESKNIGVADGKYYGALENLKWYEKSMSQGAENGEVQDYAALGMWLQLRNKDFGGWCSFVVHGQTRTAVSVLLSRSMMCALLLYPYALTISKMLVVVLAYTNAMKGAAISKMLYGIPMFVFRPP